MKIFVKLCKLIALVGVVYALAWIFNLLPQQYTPGNLVDNGYNNFKDFVAKDSTSNSRTAALSKAISDHINKSEQTAVQEAAAAAEQKKTEQANTPLGKAQEATQQYQNQIQKEKTELDNL